MTPRREEQGLLADAGEGDRAIVRVEVEAADAEWRVRAGAYLRNMTFPTTGQAERFARCLGKRLVRLGRTVEIRIYRHDGGLAGRIVMNAGGDGVGL